MGIRHREFSPIAHNLSYVPPGKTKSIESIGMIESGEYDYGIIDRREIIKVISGLIWINDVAYDSMGKACEITPGTRVVFRTSQVSRYMCDFPDETR